MQQRPVDPALLELYMARLCTPEQQAIIRAYLHDPAYRESLDEWLQRDWQRVVSGDFSADAGDFDEYRQFLSLLQHDVAPVASVGPADPVASSVPVRRMQSGRWRRVAAAAILMGLTFWGGWQWRQSQQRRQIAALESQWVYLRNEAGKRSVILLPDSTQVFLAAVSSLRYNKNFGVTNRKVVLEGEAYFIAKHGHKYPFSVGTGAIETVDIGTAFNIRYRSNEADIKVAVAEGAVDVVHNNTSGSGAVTSLKRLQLLSFDTATLHAEVITLPDASAIGSWREGKLSFYQVPLGDVAAELERFYGLHIRFAHPGAAATLITTTIQHASAAEAMDILGLTAIVKITMSGKDVLIQ